MTWGEVPRFLRNGVIRGYKVLYNRRSQTSVLTKNVPANVLSVTLGELAKFKLYNVSVLAYTSKGDGPKSEVFQERTYEDGKRTFYSISSLSNDLLVKRLRRSLSKDSLLTDVVL